MPGKDLQLPAIVIRRVNYGEADRILTLITPQGRLSAIAKGVRKAKSRLAGGVEMFSLSTLNLHEGKGELYTVTGARMERHYGEILKDLARMELAGEILKLVGARAEGEGAEFFEMTKQSLETLNNGEGLELVRAWFFLNLLSITEGINLHRDTAGAKLAADLQYDWDMAERAFAVNTTGRYGVDEIKLLRLIIVSPLATITRVKASPETWSKVLEFARMVT